MERPHIRRRGKVAVGATSHRIAASAEHPLRVADCFTRSAIMPSLLSALLSALSRLGCPFFLVAVSRPHSGSPVYVYRSERVSSTCYCTIPSVEHPVTVFGSNTLATVDIPKDNMTGVKMLGHVFNSHCLSLSLLQRSKLTFHQFSIPVFLIDNFVSP